MTDGSSASGSAPLALVSGAAGAIGTATVRAFVEAGYLVLGLDRAAVEPSEPDQRVRWLQVDVGDAAALEQAVEMSRDLGSLRHVVGIAGGALPGEPTAALDPMLVDAALFRGSIEANLTTQFLVLRATLPWLRESPGTDRSITLTSSFNALSGYGMPAYSAAKAGLIGLMHALTAPLGADGIRVNVVAPGTIRTPRTERIWAHDRDHWERLRESTALGRLGSPVDVARTYLAVATLLTHVTGQVLVVDGGQLVKRD